MTTPIQAADVSHAIDCGFVQAAGRRLDEVPMSKAVLLEPPTLSELEEVLGERVQRCELWEGNWRNRVYRLELARGGFFSSRRRHTGLQGDWSSDVCSSD